MRLGKILFFLCLPALIWNAPLISTAPIDERASFSPWDLLKFENLIGTVKILIKQVIMTDIWTLRGIQWQKEAPIPIFIHLNN